MQAWETARFDQAVSALGGAADGLLCSVSEEEKSKASQIRLRIGAPACLSLPSGLLTVGSIPVTKEQMKEMILHLCGYSIYTHQHELAAGYISVPGGHRAGICGRASLDGGKITSVSDITSICLRIAREHSGCGDRLIKELFDYGVCSAVIVGEPGSGKTTLLRDIACGLAEGKAGRQLSVAVVDERGEFAMNDESGGTSRICRSCDVLSGYPRADGITQALRSLAPDVIVCDEVACEKDANAILAGINAGVHIICSLHAGSPKELALRKITRLLLGTKAFDRFALLCGRVNPGAVRCILNREELYVLAGGNADSDLLGADRVEHERTPAQTCFAAG